MCGLFAVLSRSAPLGDIYRPSLGMLAHRGPDGSGVELVSVGKGGERLADRAWLGHRRLSIIDPTERGAQPMATKDGRFVIVFNGEIYNYVELREECRAAGVSFETGTDTEVLLALWALKGEGALPRLKGMFAFVIVDRVERVAYLARDQFGIKPLHYAVTANRIFVSSEIAPIVATGEVPADIDPLQSFEYVRFGASVSEDRTALREVAKLPPASIARFDFATGTLDAPRRFWALRRNPRSLSFDAAVEECRERFLDNVRLHLRSDVPVGAALSGGIDSSAIVCAIHHLDPSIELNTFSFISSDPAQSEEKWVDIVNAHIGAKPHKVRPGPVDLAGDLEALVRAQGEPFATSSIYAQFRVFKMAREAGVPVTLDGQGADEILGGYWPFLGTVGAAQLRRARLDRLARLVWRGGSDGAAKAAILANIGQASLPAGLLGGFRRAIGRTLFPAFLDPDYFREQQVDWRAASAAMIGRYHDLHEHLIDSTTRTSLPPLLRIADRSSMAFSVESRVPFLTPDFAEFLMSLPSEYLISPDGVRKHVFREAMRGILPDAIRQRRDKIGFFADDSLWLRTNWSSFAPHIDRLAAMPMFAEAAIRRYLDDFVDRRHDEAWQVWRIFMFAIWSSQMSAVARAPMISCGGR